MYYFVRQNLFETLNIIDFNPPASEVTISDWVNVDATVNPAAPLVCELLPEYGSEFADYFDVTLPVMSRRLIAFLKQLGVDNFQQYPVVFKHPTTGREYRDHSAVKFSGVYDAIDRERSEKKIDFGEVCFEGSIVIDPKRVGELSVFRLKDGPNFLVATERVANALKTQNFKALLLQPTEEYSGT
ncbi:MAG TPA: hypothetical protein PKB12_06680 [Elusimicrobiota bacterium]|nr:hypothetical protein [Elusimicrobiota bacterium]HNC74702.1 hypothetical protein [Elusimicrobiota bacterium]